jgi:hypothetical protein
MSYEYDVFLSYRRHKEWPIWVKDTFLQIFEHYLGEELGTEDVRVFMDVQIETGNSWPIKLANALSKSKILVPLWSPQYFNSSWCLKELALFIAREREYGFGIGDNHERLIVPAVLHDKENFPEEATNIQFREIQDYCNIRAAKGSELLEKLAEEIKDWVPDVCAAIRRAPEFDSSWASIEYEEYLALFEVDPPTSKKLTL